MSKSKKFTAEQLTIISKIQEERGSTLGAAKKYFTRNLNRYANGFVPGVVATLEKSDKAFATKEKKAKKEKAAKDGKSAAANDKPETTEKVLTKAAISARAAGVKLYIAAGRPTQTQLLRVFGKDGGKMTWAQRAEHAGLDSAEECAAQFQEMLTRRVGK